MSTARACRVTGQLPCFSCLVQEIGLEAARNHPAFSKARAPLRLVKEYPMKPAIDMKPVQSSNIRAIGHDAAAAALVVEFTSGDFYEYANVNAEQFDALLKAESVGKHLNQHIKGKHPFKKLDPAAAQEVKS